VEVKPAKKQPVATYLFDRHSFEQHMCKAMTIFLFYQVSALACTVIMIKHYLLSVFMDRFFYKFMFELFFCLIGSFFVLVWS
jgi:hypothetical protein